MVDIKEYTSFDLAEILALYRNVGWTNYTETPQMVEKAFKNSLRILAAYENDKLIGFIRAVGDGYSILYIQDIIVHSDYQRKGIGSKLLNTILEEYKNVYQTVLLTDNTEKTIQFYKSAGFYMDTDIACRAFMKIHTFDKEVPQ